MKKICEFCGKEYDWEEGQLNWTKDGSGIKNGNVSSKRFCSFVCGKKAIIQKVKATKLKRYGNANYNNLEKNKKTCLEKYGVEYSFQSDNNKEKSKQTLLDKYGVIHISQLENIKEKVKQTKKDRYGSETYNNIEKAKQTCISRYGVENPAQVEAIKEKMQETNLKKYGYTNVMQNPIIMQKSNSRKKELETYSKSKEEDIVFQLLCDKFKKVERQYKSEKYPFACDFYIPELDLYIEYQGMWSHGKKGRKILGPYDCTNKLHQDVLFLWKKKAETSERYKGAIKVWTQSDPLKRQFAKNNNLNWIEFFTLKELKSWLITM